jgi:excisionase family DNA binding protein
VIHHSYNARIEWAAPHEDERVDDLVAALADFHVAVSRSDAGHTEAIITLPAESLRQAASTALSIAETQGEVLVLEVLPTAEFDRRLGLTPMPELLSVPEVAKALAVSPQAVRQRVESGSIPATRVGKHWLVQASVVDELVSRKGARRKAVPDVTARAPQDTAQGL